MVERPLSLALCCTWSFRHVTVGCRGDSQNQSVYSMPTFFFSFFFFFPFPLLPSTTMELPLRAVVRFWSDDNKLLEGLQRVAGRPLPVLINASALDSSPVARALRIHPGKDKHIVVGTRQSSPRRIPPRQLVLASLGVCPVHSLRTQ